VADWRPSCSLAVAGDRGSDLDQPAVDEEFGSGGKRALVRGEEYGCGGDFVSASQPAERNLVSEGVRQLLVALRRGPPGRGCQGSRSGRG
jgi:hypothetical protein